MSVKVRPYRNGGWEVDIQFRLPDGTRHRERCKAPVESKSGAMRWGQDRERHLLQHGPEPAKKEVPTRGVRAETSGGLRQSEQAQTEWRCVEGVDPPDSSDPSNWEP